jgi:hypothetical protein
MLAEEGQPLAPPKMAETFEPAERDLVIVAPPKIRKPSN